MAVHEHFDRHGQSQPGGQFGQSAQVQQLGALPKWTPSEIGSSVGKKPMCATVCPSQALFFGTLAQIEQIRPMSAPVNRFRFGGQTISTKVFMMMPTAFAARAPYVDVTAAMEDRPRARTMALTPADPFEEVQV